MTLWRPTVLPLRCFGKTVAAWVLWALAFTWQNVALADQPTPGYPERVLQWTVTEGETCGAIAAALYKSKTHAHLLQRYNSIRCEAGKPLAAGTTLVVPASVTRPPTATLRSMNPDVQARPPGGGWSAASPGMPLHPKYSVHTLKKARADIRFLDRTRVYLAEHTLVVIYGTAAQTQVTKKKPITVELEAGEVQAGLAALRGKPVNVSLAGGGRVTARSRDAVVKRKKTRTTVSVFDGEADVTSAGRKITVPTRFGTSFIQKKPPKPPRPLPPAPGWIASSSQGVVLVAPGRATIGASWSPVPKAQTYRFEVARDPAFTELVVREEVPANVQAFRGQNMPAGNYYLRVRAIDDEDFLGLAAATRSVTLVPVRHQGGHPVSGQELRVHPYGVLEVENVEGLSMGLDDGPFGPPANIDFLKQMPNRIRFRAPEGKQDLSFTVQYAQAEARVEVGQRAPDNIVAVTVAFSGFEGIDVAVRVGPQLRVHLEKGAQALPLTRGAGGVFATSLRVDAGVDTLRFDVVDARGRLLGTTTANVAGLPPPPPPPEKLIPPGVTAPPIHVSSSLNVPWRAPRPTNAATVDGAVSVRDGELDGQGRVRAAGRVKWLGFDALVASNGWGESSDADTGAWLGLRVFDRFGDQPTEWGFSFRAAIPTSSTGQTTRLEPALGIGARIGPWSWLLHGGVRFAVNDDDQRVQVPSAQEFVLAGGTFDATPWLRAYSVLDFHLLEGGEDVRGRGGLSVGAEAGTTFFGSLGFRASPWDDPGGWGFGQLGLGVREW